jgi:hypothetical protein
VAIDVLGWGFTGSSMSKSGKGDDEGVSTSAAAKREHLFKFWQQAG